jgi:REP element-mobilizing transposase RayT
LKVSADVPEGFYHCVSRVVDRRFIFREVEKQKFVALMRECEAFCRVQVLTYALMSNHFHVLVAVPRRPDTLPPAAEVLESLRQMTGHTSAGLLEVQLAQCRKSGDAAAEAKFLEPYYSRMWDVSQFMKLLKQRSGITAAVPAGAPCGRNGSAAWWWKGLAWPWEPWPPTSTSTRCAPDW